MRVHRASPGCGAPPAFIHLEQASRLFLLGMISGLIAQLVRAHP